jgi:hypothetical protein
MTAADWNSVMDNFFFWIIGLTILAAMAGFFTKD